MASTAEVSAEPDADVEEESLFPLEQPDNREAPRARVSPKARILFVIVMGKDSFQMRKSARPRPAVWSIIA